MFTLAYSKKICWNRSLGYSGASLKGTTRTGNLVWLACIDFTSAASTALYDDSRTRQVARAEYRHRSDGSIDMFFGWTESNTSG
jgi:hypothetical protein